MMLKYEKTQSCGYSHMSVELSEHDHGFGTSSIGSDIRSSYTSSMTHISTWVCCTFTDRVLHWSHVTDL